MSRPTAGFRTVILIIVAVAVITLLGVAVSLHVVRDFWWVLGLVVSAVTWSEIAAALKRRRMAGPVLATADSVLVSLGQYRADYLVLFAYFAASYPGITSRAHNSLLNGLAMALAAATFGVRCLAVGLGRRAITQRGVVGSGEFIRWEEIDGYEWGGAQANLLALRLKRTAGRSGRALRWAIPPERKEAVDRLLSQHVGSGQ